MRRDSRGAAGPFARQIMRRPSADATVSVFDHGLLYGDGVFEGIRAYNGRVFKLERHIERLFDSAKAIRLEIPHTPAEVCDIVLDTSTVATDTIDYVVRDPNGLTAASTRRVIIDAVSLSSPSVASSTSQAIASSTAKLVH